MAAVEGVFFSLSLLLALAGGAKLARPAGAAAALAEGGLPSSNVAVYAVGSAELAIGGWALATGSSPAAALVAACYLAFATFTLRLRAGERAAGCGCFGSTTSPVSVGHVVFNAAAAVVSLAVAARPSGGVIAVLDDQPLGGVPFAVLVLVATVLSYLALTALPLLLEETRRVGARS